MVKIAPVVPNFNSILTRFPELIEENINPHAFTCVPLDHVNARSVKAGAALHWLRPKLKVPANDGWSTAPKATESDLLRSYRPGQNIGIRLGEWSKTPAGYLHAIDMDIRKPEAAAEAWATVRRLVPTLDELPTVVSGSGTGRHFYFWNPTPLRSEKLAKGDDWEIELFGSGKQVVLPPSIHPKTGQPYRWEKPIKFELVDLGIGPTVAIRQEAHIRRPRKTKTTSLQSSKPTRWT